MLAAAVSPSSAKLDSPSAQRNKEFIWKVLHESNVFAKKQQNSDDGEETIFRVLEIAAGVGVHSHYFCQQLLQLQQHDEDDTKQSVTNNNNEKKVKKLVYQWYATDPSFESRQSIEAYREDNDGEIASILQPPLSIMLDQTGMIFADTKAAADQEDDDKDSSTLTPTTSAPAIVADLFQSHESNKKKPLSFDLILCINMIHISPWDATVGLFQTAQDYLTPDTGILYCYGPYREHGTAVESNLKFEEWLKEKSPDFGLRNLEDVVSLADTHGLELCQRVDMPANNLSLLYKKKKEE